MIVLGFVVGPSFMEFTFSLTSCAAVWRADCCGLLFYMNLHELVHGAFMQAFSRRARKVRVHGLYAYAGSTALFGRRQYLVIAFAPVVLSGFALAVLNVAFLRNGVLGGISGAGDQYLRRGGGISTWGS
jgi:hypothetical protein